MTDLTLHPVALDLTGITKKEMLLYFQPYLDLIKTKQNIQSEKLLEQIKIWYNGYSFDGQSFVYNPYSLLSFFSYQKFRNFWFSTATPTMLVKKVKSLNLNPKNITEKQVTNNFFEKFDIENIDIYSLLFQTGYLTIKKSEIKRKREIYFLGYPNLEVANAFAHNLLEEFTDKAASTISEAMIKMEDALSEGEISDFIEQLKIIFSDISYHLLPKPKNKKEDEFAVWEGYFHTIIYLICIFLKLNVESEITHHKIRLDLKLETDEHLYIIEFKLNETVEDAMAQIKNKKYTQSYKNSPKTVHLVGINFSKTERNVDSWSSEIWIRDI